MPDDLSSARRAEHSVAACTTGLLLICLALDAVAIVSGFSQRTLLARAVANAPLLPGDPATHAVQHPTIGALKAVVVTCTAILWLIWLHRAYGNLTLVGSKRLRFSARRAVGYWFIPFVNAVRAYQIMKDLWLRTESMNDRDGYDRLPAPALLSVWWGICLTWVGLEGVLSFVVGDAYSLEQSTNVADLGTLANALGLVAAGLAIRVVREIDRSQQHFREVGDA